MALHAFVAMPFGVKQGIDFNKVYEVYIQPALESAGFEVFRADEEMRAGKDKTALAGFATETIASRYGRRISRGYHYSAISRNRIGSPWACRGKRLRAH